MTYICVFQVYGDAVVDEAPLMVLSNYHVTYFIKRNLEDVKDKTLYVSPPIPWNSRDLPVRAAWLFFLSVAAQCLRDGVKGGLLREEVPVTPSSGYRVAEINLSVNAAWVKGFASAPTREMARHHGKAPSGVQQRVLTFQDLGFSDDCISASSDAKVFKVME